MPRSMRRPEVGSGTATQFEAFWVADVILPNVKVVVPVAWAALFSWIAEVNVLPLSSTEVLQSSSQSSVHSVRIADTEGNTKTPVNPPHSPPLMCSAGTEKGSG